MFKIPKLRGKLDETMKGKNLEAGKLGGITAAKVPNHSHCPPTCCPPPREMPCTVTATTPPSQLPGRKAFTIPRAGCLVCRDGKNRLQGSPEGSAQAGFLGAEQPAEAAGGQQLVVNLLLLSGHGYSRS